MVCFTYMYTYVYKCTDYSLWIRVWFASLSLIPTCLCPLTLALDQTQQVRTWTLARGEGRSCCFLSQLWPATSTTAGHWRKKQTGQDTGRCLGSGYGQWKVEKGESDQQIFLTRSDHAERACVVHVCTSVKSFLFLVPPGEWYSTASLGSFNHCLLSCWWGNRSDHVWRECRSMDWIECQGIYTGRHNFTTVL